MQRSRFYRIRRMNIPAALVCAAAYWTPAAIASGPLETIFSAENALYGAGYDIGRADGWIDDTLRRAIRQYQTDTGELTVSGNLDAPTLDALGIRARSPRVIAGNVVSRQDQALAALNLQSPESSRPAARPVARSEPAPERAPEPAPQSTPELAPEPAPEPVATTQPTPAPPEATAP
ncbi:MAG: peptidoglycan-binding protein, partial [Marinobacter sp.]|uniref:peptidoglycan-binding domain-containing protein n=1 Tax=Marinobacter sp. TaxID=50741 RepID=UPI003C3EA4E0